MDFSKLVDIRIRRDGRRTPKDFIVFPDGGIRRVLVGNGGMLQPSRRGGGVGVQSQYVEQVPTPAGPQPAYYTLAEAYGLDSRDEVRARGYDEYAKWFAAGAKTAKGLRQPGQGSSFPESWLPEVVVQRRVWAKKGRGDAGYTPPEAVASVATEAELPPKSRKGRRRAEQEETAGGDLERLADS